MRTVFGFMALFAMAVASALFVSYNQGTVTLFWPPYRVDVSMNFALLALALGFVVVYVTTRTLATLWSMPQQARRWRLLQKERAIQAALLEALSHFVGGRFVRARKAAESVVELQESVTRSGEVLGYAERLRVIAHLVAAESAHAVQDRGLREQHLQLALDHAVGRTAQDTREGLFLRAARWALNDHDAPASLQWLDKLPQGAARRTVALRLRFKAARFAGQLKVALETARLLNKHRAFSEAAGKSIAKALAIELVQGAHDMVQLQRAWDALDNHERQLPDVALEAAERCLQLGGAPAVARLWALPAWDGMARQAGWLTPALQVRLVRLLSLSFARTEGAPDADWLSRIEAAHMSNPRDPVLQYLAGVVCMRLSLWGKAQQMIKQSLPLLQDPELKRDGWLALAVLAEQRQDGDAANQAYREAAKR